MYEKLFKRLLDIIVSLVFLPFVIIAIVIISPIIMIDDPGSPFYNAPRLGKNGKFFKMFKFRSMKVNSPDIRNSDGSTYNGENDSRMTRVGKFLRKSSIDEIPQFLNVLIGDMSLIGPRAHLTTNYPGIENLPPEKQKRLRVRPGITGYNQAYFRNTVSAEQKVKNDCYYVDHVSLGFDLKILAKTITSVVGRKNIFVNNKTAAEGGLHIEPAPQGKSSKKQTEITK